MIFSKCLKKSEELGEESDVAVLLRLLAEQSCLIDADQIQPLTGDGSDRRFYRICGDLPCVAVFPSRTHPQAMAEAKSCYTIACHLADLGVPVPKVLGHDRQKRVILFEDVGDVHLHSLTVARQQFSEVQPYYLQAVDGLLKLQVVGVQGFDSRCCWDTPSYNMELMLQRESGYFLQAFCKEYLGKLVDEHGLNNEFVQLARRAARERADFLLHRDFQSRNLMVHEGKVRIIDFQGARLGPLAYDLASLLIDPYASLSCEEQKIVFDYYVEQAARFMPDFDPDRFRQGYIFLALQRNLQILGAFAFLSQQRGKSFFEQYIIPAASSLLSQLQDVTERFPRLTGLVEEICGDLHEAAPYAKVSDSLAD
ncbi:MAG: phosphotransferase [Proteobacteria bacterium]|nr:phosphotransferase [Pseudomonadota bacterium]MBU1640316.1 phosphotransferase [Pseudomonadota bacterium]